MIKQVKSEVTSVKELPSRFLPYDVTHLELRSLSLGELKYLGSKNLTEESIIEVYRKAILNYDVYDLSWSDFLFIATHISLFTKPDQIWNLKARCKNPECNDESGKRTILNIKIDSKKFIEFDDLNIPDYPIQITLSGKELEFGITTVRDHLEYMKRKDDTPEHLLDVLSMSLQIKNLGFDEAFDLLDNLRNPEDQELVGQIDELLYHHEKPLEIKCDTCGKTHKYEAALEVAAITPFRKPETSTNNRISFGKRSKR